MANRIKLQYLASLAVTTTDEIPKKQKSRYDLIPNDYNISSLLPLFVAIQINERFIKVFLGRMLNMALADVVSRSEAASLPLLRTSHSTF
jgi:hypothetical protein